MPTRTIRADLLKITIPIPVEALPRDLVPMDGPAGDPVVEVVFGDLTFSARLNGKSFRRMLKQVDELGPANVSIALAGTARPGNPGETMALEAASFQCFAQTPKPAKAESEPAGA